MLNPTAKIGIAIGVVAVAFAAGRFTVPTKVETKEVEHVVYQDRVVEKVVTVHVQDEAQKVVVYRDRIIKPDGTTIEHEVQKTDTSKHEAAATQEVKVETKYVDRVVEKTKLVEHEAPPWRVSALVGGGQAPTIVGGASLERRIIGPISIGAWGVTGQGRFAGGLSLGLDL